MTILDGRGSPGEPEGAPPPVPRGDRTNRAWKVASWILGLTAAAVLPFVATDRFFRWKPGLKARPFHSAAWKSHPEDSMRYGMVHDLVHEVGLKGRTRSEVEELLGRGDASDCTWSLGLSPDIPMNSGPQDYLTVEYGTDGRVARVRHPGDD